MVWINGDLKKKDFRRFLLERFDNTGENKMEYLSGNFWWNYGSKGELIVSRTNLKALLPIQMDILLKYPDAMKLMN